MTSNYTNHAQTSEKQEERNITEILFSFLKVLRTFWWAVAIVMIITGVLGFFRYKNNYVPNYESKATFSITAASYNGEEDRSYTNNSQLAEELSVNFDYVINNEVFYEIIEKDIGLDYMPSKIEISSVEGTNILSIVVTGKDAQLNYDVIESVVNNYGSVAEFVLGDTKIDILEEPVVAKKPNNLFSPWSDVIKFLLFGLGIGMVPCGLYAFFVRTIKSTEDVEKYLSVPCYGALPVVFMDKKQVGSRYCSVVDKNVGFRYLEAMRSVSSRCERVLKKQNCKVILVTSTKEGEGKSTISMNLAYSLSKAQCRVMLIDGNLRKPSLRKMTGVETVDFSMEQFLDKKIKNSKAIVNIPESRVLLCAPNLKSINPIQCLNSDEMEKFIQEVKEVVDYVIIDAPHCGETSDAAVLAKYSDGVIYVVKEDETRVNKIMDTIQEFSYTRTPIIGCVLNGTIGRLNSLYGYSYEKRYGYGKKYGYGKRYGYGKSYGYGYGGYGYGDYGYGEYGEVSEEEFSVAEKKVSKKISLTTTEDEKRALLEERKQEENEE